MAGRPTRANRRALYPRRAQYDAPGNSRQPLDPQRETQAPLAASPRHPFFHRADRLPGLTPAGPRAPRPTRERAAGPAQDVRGVLKGPKRAGFPGPTHRGGLGARYPLVRRTRVSQKPSRAKYNPGIRSLDPHEQIIESLCHERGIRALEA